MLGGVGMRKHFSMKMLDRVGIKKLPNSVS